MLMERAGAFGQTNQCEIVASLLSPSGERDMQEIATVRAIVRGEWPVSGLNDTRIKVSAKQIEWPSDCTNAIPIHAADLAEGMINLGPHPAALIEWASFILVASDLFHFENRKSSACDRLLSAIWGLAFGMPLESAKLRLAHSVRSIFAQA